MALATLRIDVLSSFQCPWCWLCSKQLATALVTLRRRAGPMLHITVRWWPHFLFPGVEADAAGAAGSEYGGGAAGGTSGGKSRRLRDKRQMYLSRFGGDANKVSAMEAQFGAALAALGEPGYSVDGVVSSSLDAHRLCAWVGERLGDLAQWSVADELFRAYHVRGQDLSDHSVLEAAAQAALRQSALAEATLAELGGFLRSDQMRDEVRLLAGPSGAHRLGMQDMNGGVPHVKLSVVGGLQLEVPGAQSADYFLRMAERLVARSQEQVAAVAEGPGLSSI
jgi:predicted DsbA family dithiol-disulfide isomerase